MPGSLGRMFGKVGGMLGPLLMAAAPLTGPAMPFVEGAGLAADVGSGIENMTNPAAPPTLPSIKAPAMANAPIGGPPSIPTPAGQGLTLSGGGAGPSPGAGAGVQSPDLINQAVASALGSQNPFGAYGVSP